MEFQELMRERFEAVIEEATGRHVIGFMSGNQQDPDMMCEVFILAPDRPRRRRRGGQNAQAVTARPARPTARSARLTRGGGIGSEGIHPDVGAAGSTI